MTVLVYCSIYYRVPARVQDDDMDDNDDTYAINILIISRGFAMLLGHDPL